MLKPCELVIAKRWLAKDHTWTVAHFSELNLIDVQRVTLFNCDYNLQTDLMLYVLHSLDDEFFCQPIVVASNFVFF